METDRLAEEKKRGITIELGFAYLDLPNGAKAGIVDVPGHEKFVRNMLAGAGSIDLAILVIAADEGIMPQTREHLAILNLLGLKHGLVALNKADLADNDWLDMVKLDVEEELAGTFLENAPIMPVSAYTGDGVDVLKQAIFDMLNQSPPKKTDIPFRLPIDRVFTMGGFGTVVTGTLVEGTLSVGQDVTIFPSMISTKARRIQVHGDLVEKASAGQRVAVNLAGLKVDDLSKGDLAAAANSMENSRIIDISLEINKDCVREIRHNSRLHLHHGTADVLCTLSLIGAEKLTAGQSAYGQLRLAQNLAAKPGDRFILRFYSPTETIGGGLILDPMAQRVKRTDSEAAKRLETKLNGSEKERIEVIFAEKSNAFAFPKAENIKRQYFYDADDFDGHLANMIKSGVLAEAGGAVLHISFINEIGKRAQNILEKYHKTNPLHAGMAVKELCGRLLPRNTQAVAEEVIEQAAKRGFVKKNGQDVAHINFKATATDGHKKIRENVMNIYNKAGFLSPDADEVAAKFIKEKRDFLQVFQALIKSGELVALTPKMHCNTENYNKALDVFTNLASKTAEVTLADFRDAIGASRKYAMAYLEHFDKKGITEKLGEGRILK